MALKGPCEKLGSNELGDFAAPARGLEIEIAEAKDILAKGGAILSENIVAHCLKAFLPDSSYTELEKEKRRSLLGNQMNKVKSNLFGQEESMLHPVFAETANKLTKPPPEA